MHAPKYTRTRAHTFFQKLDVGRGETSTTKKKKNPEWRENNLYKGSKEKSQEVKDKNIKKIE